MCVFFLEDASRKKKHTHPFFGVLFAMGRILEFFDIMDDWARKEITPISRGGVQSLPRSLGGAICSRKADGSPKLRLHPDGIGRKPPSNRCRAAFLFWVCTISRPLGAFCFLDVSHGEWFGDSHS